MIRAYRLTTSTNCGQSDCRTEVWSDLQRDIVSTSSSLSGESVSRCVFVCTNGRTVRTSAASNWTTEENCPLRTKCFVLHSTQHFLLLTEMKRRDFRVSLQLPADNAQTL